MLPSAQGPFSLLIVHLLCEVPRCLYVPHFVLVTAPLANVFCMYVYVMVAIA